MKLSQGHYSLFLIVWKKNNIFTVIIIIIPLLHYLNNYKQFFLTMYKTKFCDHDFLTSLMEMRPDGDIHQGPQ